MAKSKKPYCVIIFVEGATEVVFYEKLINHLNQIRETNVSTHKIINAKGIGRFESKVPGKFKNEIVPKYEGHQIAVCCCYDTDVFKFKSKPPINWDRVSQKLIENGAITIKFVKANKMIEDWFLLDIKGLCTYLKIKPPKKLKGKDGNEKMISLFKKAGKIYQKGTYCYDFVENLDIDKIYSHIKPELIQLDALLFPNDKAHKKNK